MTNMPVVKWYHASLQNLKSRFDSAWACHKRRQLLNRHSYKRRNIYFIWNRNQFYLSIYVKHKYCGFTVWENYFLHKAKNKSWTFRHTVQTPELLTGGW